MDDFFNHDVAEWIYDSVSKMDDDEAEMFARFFVYEVHKADIDNNRRTLDRHVEEVNKRVQAAAREVISKDDGTNFFDAHGQNQPRAHDGRWVKIEIGGKPSRKDSNVRLKPKRTRRTTYKDDSILLNVRGKEIDLSNALLTTGHEGNAFSRSWTTAGPDDASTNERTYRRVQAGAQLLSNVPSGNVRAAAAVAQFAGEFGPEAEKVIGPAARRTAYRYRGTERMADRELMGAQRRALNEQASGLNIDNPLKLTPEQKMSASEAAAAKYLYYRLPKKSLSSLQQSSGKLPPSEGVIINADGEIVTQAVGYNEDHYLPFNLKNLKGLKGGSYVRTRSSGGLTSEDIYTGLVSGARSITVVSRSGVFTLDFEDDLRGGRRYSDKARQMVGRYAQTLDAVQSKQVARRGLDPSERAEIRDEVEAEKKNQGYTKAEIEQLIRDREKEYMSTPRLTKDEMSFVDEEAARRSANFDRGVVRQQTEGRVRDTENIPRDPAKRLSYFRSEVMDEMREKKEARNYRLDAEGYESAMQALREQFPYYIQRVEVRRFTKEGEDAGYVRPRYNRPKAVKAGYYDEEINGRGKFPASELHYQNYRRGTGGAAVEATGEGGEKKVADKAKSRQAVKETIAVARAKERRNASFAQAVEASRTVVLGNAENEKDYPMITSVARDKVKLEDLTPIQVGELTEQLEALGERLGHFKDDAQYQATSQLLSGYVKEIKDAAGTLESRVSYNPEASKLVVPSKPNKFNDEPQHTPGNDPSLYQEKFDQLASRFQDLNITPQTSDSDMRIQQSLWGQVHEYGKQAAEGDATALNKFIEAAGKLGYNEDALVGYKDAFDLDEKGPFEHMSKLGAKNFEAYAEARSIKANAGGAVEAERIKPDVSSEVAEETKEIEAPKASQASREMIAMTVRTMAKDDRLHLSERALLNKLADSVVDGDMDTASGYLYQLGRKNKTMSTVAREIANALDKAEPDNQ